MMGVSSTRNEWLANIFYRLELIEAYGTGISKIKGSYNNALVKPYFEVTDNAFKVVLPNLNSKANRVEEKENISYYYDSREEKIVNLCIKQDSINRKDVENLLGVSSATAGLIIKRMVEKEILRKDNNGKYQRYVLGNR